MERRLRCLPTLLFPLIDVSRQQRIPITEILVFVRPIELIGTPIDALVELGWERTDQVAIYPVLVLHHFFVATRAGIWTLGLRFAFTIDFLRGFSGLDVQVFNRMEVSNPSALTLAIRAMPD